MPVTQMASRCRWRQPRPAASCCRHTTLQRSPWRWRLATPATCPQLCVPQCKAVRWAGSHLSLALVGYRQRLLWHCFQATVPVAAAVYPLVQAEPVFSIGELIGPQWLAWAEQLSDQQRGADAAAATALPSPSSTAAARASAAVDSGILDMSAFGLSSSQSEPHPVQSLPKPKQQSSAVDTGMLDMSAFGMATEPEPAPQQQHKSAMDTGMLDMSAFGLATEPEPAPQQETAQQPQQQQSSAVDTGMLDMSAFGLATEPQPASQQQSAQQQQPTAMDTGMLDMSAFGLATEPAPSQQQQPSAASQPGSGQQHVSASGLVPTPLQLPPVSTAHSSALETGQLDMAAFGGGGNSTASSRTSAAYPPGTAASRQPQRSTAPTQSIPTAEPLTQDVLAALRQWLGVHEDAADGKRKGNANAEQRADASAFSLLRLDAPESAMRDTDGTAAEDTKAVNGHTGDGGSDAAAAAASAEAGPSLPGLSRADSLRVLRLVQLAVEAAAGAAGGTAAQFLSRDGPGGGGGSHGGGSNSQAAALDAAARRAVLAMRLGMLLREAPQAPQGQGQNDDQGQQVVQCGHANASA